MLRRTFVEFTSLALVGSMLPVLGCSSSPTHLERMLSLPSALAAINDPETIAAIGESYRSTFQDEATVEKLINSLLDDTEDSSEAQNLDDATLKKMMDDKVKSDFNQGETIILNGWILSKTEARQCALFSLIQSNN